MSAHLGRSADWVRSVEPAVRKSLSRHQERASPLSNCSLPLISRLSQQFTATERRINYNMKLSKHLRRPISEFSISEQKYKYNNNNNRRNKSIHCDVKPVNWSLQNDIHCFNTLRTAGAISLFTSPAPDLTTQARHFQKQT